jgi:nucleoside-diphosphate-sugar epimerase
MINNMNILILGGTRFFGKKLVQSLVDNGHSVTVFSRREVDFPQAVSFIKGDRIKAESLKQLDTCKWDVVFDQICFNASDAKLLLDSIKTNYLVYTSSASVYMVEGGRSLTEDQINTSEMEVRYETDVEYHTGKQLAEAYYLNSGVKTACVRFPFIMGEDDYTHRLKWHVDKIKSGEEIYFPNIDAIFPILHSSKAAEFLSWLVDHQISGPINISTKDPISLKQLVNAIEDICGKELIRSEDKESHSPYGIAKDVELNCEKLLVAGFNLDSWHDWLDNLIQFYITDQ